jgi:hypothetical protein
MVFIGVNILGLLSLIAFDLVAISEPSSSGVASDTQTILEGVLALGALIVYYGSYIPAIVLFCMWLHRAVRNMPALGAFDPRWSPAGAVGRCFIPFVNLAHPMSGALEAWRGADPGRRWIDVRTRMRISPPPVIIGWWSLWLIGHVLVAISPGVQRGADPATQVTGLWIDVLGTVLLVVSGVLAILVVRELTARQDRKHELIASGTLA